MADLREIFSILQDTSTLAGAAPGRKVEGDSQGGNEMPVLPVKDLAGNLQHIPSRAAGEADGANIPVLPALNLAGNLQHVDVRATGQAPGILNQPGLIAIDPSGNLKFLEVDAFGNLNINSSPGTKRQATGIAASVVGTYTTAATLVLAISKDFTAIRVCGASTHATVWRLRQTNDMTVTTILDFVTGPGQFSFEMDLEQMVTSGASGTQNLILQGNQISGPVTDLHGNITAVEQA